MSALSGLLFVGCAFVALAVIPVEKTFIYAVTALVGLIGGTAYLVPFAHGMLTWFDKSSGSAFGIMTSGGSVFGVITTPLTALVIYNSGWKVGYLVPAGFVLLLALPTVIAFFRERTPREDSVPHRSVSADAVGAADIDSHPTRALKDWSYWALVLSFASWAFVVAAFLGNLQAMLLERHGCLRYAPQHAAARRLPNFHVSGLGSSVMALYCGGEIVIPETATVGEISSILSGCGLTHACLVRCVLSSLVYDRAVSSASLVCLEVVIYGAAPPGGSLIQDAMAM